ncbi:MAG: RNA polymerase sigma factor [Lachnospiraceae bacterium]
MFERMLTVYYDEIFRYCYHHVGSRETAEDLCQDTFVSFLENKSDYQSRGKLKNYLYTIARNKCIDYFRKAEPVCMDTLPEITKDERFEEMVAIKDLVEKLPDELREVIILRFFQELKYREIADILGIGVPKSKYLVAKALEVLEKEVSSDGTKKPQ